MKREIVGDVPSNVLGMFADLAHKLQHGSRTPEELARFLRGENPFGSVNLITDWHDFYRDLFEIKADFSNLQIPKKQKGFERLIIVAEGMMPQRLYDKCSELFPCWKWTDENLNDIVESERRSVDDAYAIWVRNRIEADKELKKLSANDLKEKEISGISLEERLLFELKYFKETGNKHLDITNITLCSGSRSSDGRVPEVFWYYGKLYVFWYHPDDAGGHLRSRRVVF